MAVAVTGSAIGLAPAVAAPGPLTITPLGWNVVGLDSNDVTAGPNRFPIGARVCNTGSDPVTNAAAAWSWSSSNANLAVVGGTTRSLGTLAAGACAEAHFLVEVTRTAAAYDTARRFTITGSGDSVASVSTPSPREIYVEKLVSQNRNATRSIKVISGTGCTPGPAPTTGQPNTGTVLVGSTCQFILDGKTATNGYEQLDAFLALDPGLFRIRSVSSVYNVPSGHTNAGFYADACGWQNDPTAGTYRDCIGPNRIGSGKAGGDPISVTVTVDVVGAGTQQVAGTIYDFSGSSFHYNSDYSSLSSQLAVTAVQPNRAPTASPVTATTAEDAATSGSLVPVTSDPDGDPLAYSLVSGPASGTGSATVSGSGWTYTPPANWSGTAVFTYSVCDPSAACASSTVSVTVTPANDPPTAGPGSATTPRDVAVTGSVAPLASDIDGDPLTFSKASDPTHGTVTVAAGGGYTYTPAAGYAGPDSFTYSACDPSAACATATVSITVTATNRPPTAAAVTATTPEDTAANGSLIPVTSDPDGDALTYSLVSGPAPGTGAASIAGSGWTYTPPANWSGTAQFTYSACDPAPLCASSTVTVTVIAVDDPPSAGPDSRTVSEDGLLSASVAPLAGDPENDPLTFTVSTPTSHGTVTMASDGSYSYTPMADYHGPDSFSYSACSLPGPCASSTVSITVTPVNDAPTAGPVAVSTPEETATGGSLIAVTGDVDGDLLTYSLVSGPAPGTGSAVVTGTGWTYTPPADWSGTAVFTYSVCDPSAACATSTVTVTVTPVNDPPAAGPDSLSTAYETAVAGSLAPLASDPDGDPLSYSISGAAAHGTVALNSATGTYSYTPNAGYSGPDSFDYTVCDPGPLCASSTVSITVGLPGNQPPVAAPTAITVSHTAIATGSLLPLVNDPDGDGLAGSLQAQGLGSVAIAPDLGYTYTPPVGYVGPDSFTYRVCDPGGLCATAVVSVTVTNAAPTAAPLTVSGPEDADLTGAVTVSDPDGDTMTITAVTSPAHGLLVMGSDGSFTFTPDAGWSGTTGFDYSVCDGFGACSSSTVTVIVTPVNDPPSALPATATTTFQTPVTGDLADLIDDADGDPLAVSLARAPGNGVLELNGDGTWRYTPADGFAGTDSFEYTVCDPSDACATSIVTITVTAGSGGGGSGGSGGSGGTSGTGGSGGSGGTGGSGGSGVAGTGAEQGGGVGQESGGSLATTGTPAAALLLGGFSLLAFGLVLRRAAGRRDAATEVPLA